ncbi:hypothetical protein PRZ48_001490 [Zasmidium cellare]|uniref:Uncharacterized protein n=1 Tax=Zasmidium cellare TaxID=395010 RepID=A0ABR0F235_ZASCE|nr:hypothetical protein PRZ48_001490 [Zasmidium cellare]
MPDFIFTNADYDEEKIKKSSRLAQSQASDQGFVFVNFDNGNNERQKQVAKRAVRSQATAYSHRVAPRGASKSDLNLRVQQKDGESSRRPSLVSRGSSESKSSEIVRKRPKNSPTPGPSPVRVANISRKRKRTRFKREGSHDSVRSDRSISPGAFETYLPNPLAMDASMRDPFGTYPVRYRSWFGQLINFWYNVVFARSTRVLKATRSELDLYTAWSRRQELSEPALFYTALYLASGIPVAEGLFPLKAALWLRYKTVEAMKEALADPERAMSTPVILAVGRIALHEHIYGNRELAHKVHRPAQLRMVTMRGGLANMGLPMTTVQLIVWTDALLSAEAGTEPYFADVPRQIAIRSYTPQEAMHVTNHCSPLRNSHPGYEGNQPESAEEPPE